MNTPRKFDSPQHISAPSYFYSLTDRNPTPVEWAKIVNLIKNDSVIESTTHFAREALTNKNQIKYTRYKSQNGAITPASQCQGGHSGINITNLTGITMVDLDHLPNADVVKDTIAKLKNDPHVFITYITCSGLGIRILAPYKASEPQIAYLDAWRWVNEFFQMVTGFPYDQATKDASRLSYLCHDTDCYFNPDAKPFFIDNSPHTIENDSNPIQQNPFDQTDKILSRQGMNFVQGQRHHYIINASFLLNKMGIDKQEVIDHFATMHEDAKEVENIVNWAYTNAVKDHATWHVYKPAKSNSAPKQEDIKKNEDTGNETKKKSPHSKRVTVRQIRNWIDENEEIRYNEVSGCNERYEKKKKKWVEINDRIANAMWEDINHQMELYVPMIDFQNVLKSDYIPAFNPLKDYIANLPQWKPGDKDYIAELMSHVHTHSDDLFHQYFPKWLVSMVASWFSPKVTNQTILTFIGAQGAYKSTFFRNLLPYDLQRYFLVKGNASYLSKDDKIAAGRYALIAFEEIDALKATEVNAIKALVTTEVIDERAAYARTRERLDHIASFCATGNNPEFLTDLTGNRRWLPFLIISIDNPYENPIDYNGLYSQIYYLYRSKFRYWNTQKDDEILASHIKQFCAPSLEEELIMQHFELPDGKKLTQFLTTTAIKVKCEAGSHFSLNVNQVSQVLKNLGFEQHKRRGVKGFLVVERTYDEIRVIQINDAAEVMSENRPKPTPPQQRTILQEIEEQDNPFLTEYHPRK